MAYLIFFSEKSLFNCGATLTEALTKQFEETEEANEKTVPESGKSEGITANE